MQSPSWNPLRCAAPRPAADRTRARSTSAESGSDCFPYVPPRYHPKTLPPLLRLVDRQFSLPCPNPPGPVATASFSGCTAAALPQRTPALSPCRPWQGGEPGDERLSQHYH
uniref:(northern house mosquito) hypothetical protein n=1 Tax=Culex pipiens TaxID=7175 RepID=A0A8D8D236_CULPI